MSERRPPRRRIRSGPTLGSGHNVSVPISIGLPLIGVGIALLVAATRTEETVYWVSGGAVIVIGLILFASGKTV